MEINQKYLQSMYEYKDGFLYWRQDSKRKGVRAGRKIGALSKSGYYQIGINKNVYYLHRLIFLYHNGYLPKEVDHIDRNKSNNTIENLRSADRKKNCYNTASRKNSTSKYIGVSAKGLGWQSQIRINGKCKYLGIFKTENEAAEKYNEYALKYRNEFANLNVID